MSMDEAVLARLHRALLVLLDEIDRICRKHGIEYFLDSGTALGAVRHGGFIPWDDDADVGMTRGEYEKFLKVAPGELGPDFFLQTRETDPDFFKFSAKLRLNGTKFLEKRNRDIEINEGIFVDIFPFDYISDTREGAIADIKKTRKLYKLWALRKRHPKDENPGRKAVRMLFRPFPEKAFENRCLRHFHQYDDHPTHTLASYNYKMNNYRILYFREADLTPGVDIPFEGRSYRIMNNYDEYLRIMYDDYMQLPPEDKRVWHFEGEIEFGKYQ